ncbi:tRNA-modifying protein YgfZ [bacterium BMS3Bbin11]|nr:tRNA-modifying protein YgfZ [bacterium BMS3Abin11]GBE45664.1 tRNA-modifying protein YgfZ [bacterium BMS3Bbin11]GMT40364.1 MAG: folate-binding protein [bacterium]HDH08886.1 folate-binding protein [Gammaproteobacteria bacterium]HDZ77698.1 folate-binding protein [Gammaproteobacteria bacterium]
MNETQAKTIRLDDLTSLRVTGSDASKFLHAQFTNDLANLAVNSWQYSGYCTPKGRLLVFMTIARLDKNEFLLILPAEISDKILSRLRMFVMRDDVTITPQDVNTSITGILGAADNLSGIGLTQKKENGKLSRDGNNNLLTIDYESGRFLYIGKSIKFDTNTSTDRSNWTLLDIQAGIPAIVLATQETFVPQMVNLDLIGAVNFKKGCYPGQEIVARVHYLGKIKQRMFVAETSRKELAQPNDKIYIAGQPDKAAGTVVQAAISDSNQCLQVVLQTKVIDENLDLRLGSPDGEKLTMGTQPYSVLSVSGDEEEN